MKRRHGATLRGRISCGGWSAFSFHAFKNGKHRPWRDIQPCRNLTSRQSSSTQLCNCACVQMECARATEYRSAFTRCCQAGIDALPYYASLKLSHSSKNVHLEATGRIAFACVDPLRRRDEVRAFPLKLT